MEGESGVETDAVARGVCGCGEGDWGLAHTCLHSVDHDHLRRRHPYYSGVYHSFRRGRCSVCNTYCTWRLMTHYKDHVGGYVCSLHCATVAPIVMKLEGQ